MHKAVLKIVFFFKLINKEHHNKHNQEHNVNVPFLVHKKKQQIKHIKVIP